MVELSKQKGLGFVGGFLWVVLSLLLTPFGGLILAYFMFRGKEPRKWKTAVIIFWCTLIPPLLLIFSSFLPLLAK